MWKNKVEVNTIILKEDPHNRPWYVVIVDKDNHYKLPRFLKTIRSKNPKDPWFGYLGINDLSPIPEAKKMVSRNGELKLGYDKIFKYIRNVEEYTTA